MKNTRSGVPRSPVDPPHGANSRRSAPVPPFLGVPSAVPGGRAVRSIALTFGVAAALVGVVSSAWVPEVAAHAGAHPDRCIDVPVARFSSTDCCGDTRSIRVEVQIPRVEVGTPPTFRVGGKTLSVTDLRRYLCAMADRQREGPTGPNAPSAIWVDIRADRLTPWEHTQHVLQACADPEVRIYKLRFVVRPPGSRPCTYGPASVTVDPITTPLEEQLR